MIANFSLVTVITLTYKKFDHFRHTIKSIFLQDYPRIELIISDDGSNNFPKKLLDDLIISSKKENIINIRVLHEATNIGTVRNANRAFKAAQGKYIFDLGCGDAFFETTTISKIVKRFEETHAKLIVTSRIMYNTKFTPLCMLPHYHEFNLIKRHNTPHKQYKALLIGPFYDMASGSGMYYTNDLVKEMNYFDENYTLWEDGPFLAKYLWKYSLEFAYDIVSIWYESGGISSPKTKLPNAMIEDIKRFQLIEKNEHLEIFSPRELKMLQLIQAIFVRQSKVENLKLMLKYFPQIIRKVFYRIGRIMHKWEDNSKIKKILLSPNLINIDRL